MKKILLSLLLLQAAPAFAQEQTGQVLGRNLDASWFTWDAGTQKYKLNTGAGSAFQAALQTPNSIAANALSGAGSSTGQVLTSTGAGTSPTWQNSPAPAAGSINNTMFAAGSEATTTVLGTVRYADNASTVAGTSNRVVTDATLKNALSTGQPYSIDVRTNGTVSTSVSLDGNGHGAYNLVAGNGNGSGAHNLVIGGGYGHGAYNQVAGNGNGSGAYNLVTGAGNGNGAYNLVAGNGNGHGAYNQVGGNGNGHGAYNLVTGAGNGHGAYNVVGYWQPTTGIASYSENGPLGLRDTVGAFNRVGTNTTWGITTNAGIYTAGGVTTSDKRVKENIVGINADNAIKLLDGIRFVQYDKLTDKSSIIAIQERQNNEGREKLKQAKQKLERLKFDEDGDGKLSQEERKARQAARALEREKIQDELKQHEEQANMVLPTDSKSLFVAKQAGVIAQELQELTAKIGDFKWLVKLSNPNDKNSIFVVDYTSLEIILSFAQREKTARLEARIAALEKR